MTTTREGHILVTTFCKTSRDIKKRNEIKADPESTPSYQPINPPPQSSPYITVRKTGLKSTGGLGVGDLSHTMVGVRAFLRVNWLCRGVSQITTAPPAPSQTAVVMVVFGLLFDILLCCIMALDGARGLVRVDFV
eukprot:gene1013-1989_t